jgi:hypothetical protein
MVEVQLCRSVPDLRLGGTFIYAFFNSENCLKSTLLIPIHT